MGMGGQKVGWSKSRPPDLCPFPLSPFSVSKTFDIDNISAICTPQTQFIGSMGIRPSGEDETLIAEFGYRLGEEYWGRGIMSDAAKGFAK
jgi:RimJ/RimL family protein N-acetyltransferase